MTPEQEKQVAEIRKAHELAKLKLANLGIEPVAIAAHLDRGGLLSIFDALQKQQPKRCTEAELRAAYESWVKLNWLEETHGKALEREGGGYSHRSVNDRFSGWFECARFLGAIKTEAE